MYAELSEHGARSARTDWCEGAAWSLLSTVGSLRLYRMTQELSDAQVAKVRKILAERARATRWVAGTFLPPLVGIVEETMARRHQLIVGRRGVGKSMLLLNVVSAARDADRLVVYLDLETFRGIPYPDVLIRLLATLAADLGKQIRVEIGWTRTVLVRRKLRRLERDLTALLIAPQESTTALRNESQSDSVRSAGFTSGIRARLGRSWFSLKLRGSNKKSNSTHTVSAAEFTETKMQGLQGAAPEFRIVLERSMARLNGPALFVLDDFYFIPRAEQAAVSGYLHQILKGLDIWLKIGGVEHRLETFVEGDPPVGLQPYHDAGLIRLDVTLRDFNHTRDFLEGILGQVLDETGVTIEMVITGTGRERLVLASGGVPRDYLALVGAALQRASKRDGAPNRPHNKINAEDVSEVAPAFLDQKEQDLKLDASVDDVDRLRERFNDVVKFCVHEHRRNVFLVEAVKLREEQWAIDLAALAELRFVHKVANLTVKSSNPKYTGRRYEAFVLDLSAYAGSRVRDIEMIEFWESGGLQKIRGVTFVYEPEVRGERQYGGLENVDGLGTQLVFEVAD